MSPAGSFTCRGTFLGKGKIHRAQNPMSHFSGGSTSNCDCFPGFAARIMPLTTGGVSRPACGSSSDAESRAAASRGKSLVKPVLAISPEAVTLKSRVDGRGAFCGVSYSQAIELAGGVPSILPLTRNRHVLDHFLKRTDGLLLTGGGDVNPARYGARLSAADRATLSGVDDVRDEMETYLLRTAARSDLPVLGICRGIQIMNVAFGGTLIPDLIGHRNSKPDVLAHRIEWTADGKLRRALAGCDRVNSSHHQAADRTAEGFEVVARAPDGVIEAMEKRGARFFCAVQCHPERLVQVAPRFLRLFKALVAAAR